MSLPDLYSRRKRATAQSGPDVYQYSVMSPQLREQIILSFQDMASATNGERWTFEGPLIKAINVMRRETGKASLYPRAQSKTSEFFGWFRTEPDIDALLDAVEAFVKLVTTGARRSSRPSIIQNVERVIATINGRMMEDGFGYQIQGLQLIQVSDQFAHAEIIVPALTVLSESKFVVAGDEFRHAHADFRAGLYPQSITNFGKSLESVFKVIAEERSWAGIDENSNLSQLIGAAIKNGLFPGYMDAQITGLRTLLQGPGTIRNKDGAHGKGNAVSNADRELAAYQLHQTAAAIIFLSTQ